MYTIEVVHEHHKRGGMVPSQKKGNSKIFLSMLLNLLLNFKKDFIPHSTSAFYFEENDLTLSAVSCIIILALQV